MHRMIGVLVVVAGAALIGTSCAPPARTQPAAAARVRPGITVLLDDSIHLIRGRRLGLVTNQTGIDARGESDIDLLRSPRATGAGARLVMLFSPEHGIRGTEDREQIASGVDERSGLPIVSLYTNGTVPPPDSTLRGLDVLVLDLQDIGTRTWTYVGEMLYSMRAAKRRGMPIIVLDRPNPVGGVAVSGPVLDTALAAPNDPQSGRPAKAYAIWPFPLRHGMTMGELARFYNEELGIGAELHVVPAAGWRRAMWLDETGLPWVRPSPNLPDLTSALVYPSLVAFEGSNVSVGRGTADAFQRFGAPWMDAPRVAAMLEGRSLPGVRFVVDPFTPSHPGDSKYDGQRIPGVKIVVTDRARVASGRVAAAVLWALARTAGDSLRLRPVAFDERFGSSAIREAIMRGDDPDAALARDEGAFTAFTRRAARYRLYK